MNTIKVKRKIRSSTLRLKELEKFINKEVEIKIKTVKELKVKKSAQNNIKEDLLSISIWNISSNSLV